MTNSIAKIRAALEHACEYIRSDLASERGAFEGHEGVSRIDEIKADLASNAAALAALAELEKASAEPVAWMWNDEIGVPHASAGSKKPVWLESSASAEYIKQANLRPLYAAPPAPVAKMREPTPEECKRIAREYYGDIPINAPEIAGSVMFDAVRAVMWPKSEAK